MGHLQPPRCPSSGTRGSRFNPLTKHQASPVCSPRRLCPAPHCGREALSPAPGTQTPDLGKSLRGDSRSRRSPQTGRLPPLASSPVTLSLVSEPPTPLGGTRLGGAAGRGPGDRRGPRRRGAGSSTPAGPGRGASVRRLLRDLLPVDSRPALPGGAGSGQAPASARRTRVSLRRGRLGLPSARPGPAAELARRVWAPIWAAHRRPLPHPSRRRPDKDAQAPAAQAALAKRGSPGTRAEAAPEESFLRPGRWRFGEWLGRRASRGLGVEGRGGPLASAETWGTAGPPERNRVRCSPRRLLWSPFSNSCLHRNCPGF